MHGNLPRSVRTFAVMAVLGTLFMLPVHAVGDAYFPDDTAVELNGVTYTVAGGSDADEVTTSGGTMTVLISGGQQVVFKSPDRKILTNDGGLPLRCSTTESSISISYSEGAPQRTVRVTPDANTCDALGGGRGSDAGVRSAPEEYGLREGDVVGAYRAGDPDIYIVNEFGFKRLFLNPVIFRFYGHLGGFSVVRSIDPAVRDRFATSGLFRNCETNSPKVYGLEVTGEDSGVLHWVNTTGLQAATDDPDFFRKVFCINGHEFSWYDTGVPYTAVSQIPRYSRGGIQ